MNLGGIPTEMPLYDQQGNLIQEPTTMLSQPEELSVVQPEDLAAMDILEQIKTILTEVDDIGAELSCSDQINVFDYATDGNNVDREYYTFTIFGGKNGHGLWSNYLKVFSDLMLRLEAQFEDAWITGVKIDSSDDVFDVEVAILPYM